LSYVCGLCDNFIKEEGLCKYDKTRGRDASIDEEALKKYNLSIGQKTTVRELFEQYRQLAKISALPSFSLES